MKMLILVSACLAGTSAHAQFKCVGADGAVAFQQSPCPGDAKATALKLPQRAAAKLIKDSSVIDRVLATCRAGIPKQAGFFDPESIRFGDPSGAVAEVEMRLDDGSYRKAWRLFVPINAKNRFGGYVGETLLTCYTDREAQGVIGVSKYLME